MYEAELTRSEIQILSMSNSSLVPDLHITTGTGTITAAMQLRDTVLLSSI